MASADMVQDVTGLTAKTTSCAHANRVIVDGPKSAKKLYVHGEGEPKGLEAIIERSPHPRCNHSPSFFNSIR